MREGSAVARDADVGRAALVPLAAADRGEPLFFYGTLTDADVLARVLGRGTDAGDLEPARLRGFRRVRAAAASYPVLAAAPGETVAGLLLLRPSRRDIARVNRFERGEYRARLLAVGPAAAGGAAERAAWVDLARDTLPATDLPWDAEGWRREHKAGMLAACEGWMAGWRRWG